MDSLLEVRRLEVVYHTQKGQRKALHDVNFNVQGGEIVGVVGESGCGKSTLASTLLRLLPPNGEIRSGALTFNGQDLHSLSAEQLRRIRGSELAMIFQDPMSSLNPVFTVGEQIFDVQRAHTDNVRIDAKELRRRAVEILEQVGIPDPTDRLQDYPHEFSGGMRQRILIAMALISQPALLIADEPTSSLDVTLEAQILELLNQLRHAYQTAILFISHDLGVIAQLCDRVIVMYAGRVVEQGNVQSIFDNPKHPYTQALLAAVPSRKNRGRRLVTIPGRVPSLLALPLGCKFASRCQHVRAACHITEPDLYIDNNQQARCFIYDPTSHFHNDPPLPPPKETEARLEVRRGHRNGSVQPDEALIELNGVSIHYDERSSLLDRLHGQEKRAVRAVDEVDLDVRAGEIIGLVGESGSGKTTLGKAILRLAPLTDGQIMFEGKDISRVRGSLVRRLRSRMQMIFQDPYSSLSPRLRVSYLLTEPYTIHHIQPEKRLSVAELLQLVGLSEEQATKFPHELSGGQARRIGIARALALQPKFLVADEPSSGLDVSVAASILNLMKDIADNLGLTYMIITHNLNLVAYIATRMAVMYLGKIMEVGPTERIFDAPAHPYTLALLSAISEPDPHQQHREHRMLLGGEIPSPRNPPPGCRFHTRCRFAEAQCKTDVPPLEVIEPDHMVACHFWERVRTCQELQKTKENADT